MRRSRAKHRRKGQTPAPSSAPRSQDTAPDPGTSREEIREQLREELLAQITHGGRLCAELESQLGKNPPPELETLIKLYRVMILKFSAEANVAPEIFKLVTDLMKPVMDWARLQEKRRERELAERKYRDQVEAEKAARAKADKAGTGGAGLSPETHEKIERELKLI
ncbi:MAG: hypothetical protein ACREIC_04410 [Limisphaerales bacterium]